MKILGISAFYHDSAAAIVQDGKIIAAAQEERWTRKKNDSCFPVNAIKYCLEYSVTSIDELDAIVFYDKPLLKFERLLETYYAFAPKGLKSFISAMPVWLEEKMFLKRVIFKELNKIEKYNKHKIKLLFPEHHLSHAASAFYASPFEESAILTVDAVGEWATASLGFGKKNKIKILKELRFPHSVGLLYSAFTYFLGFKVNSGEYKLMGLAPYGNPKSENVKKFIKIIKKNLVEIKQDSSIWLNQDYFNYTTGLRMVKDKKWEKLFGFPKRATDSKLEQQYCDLAYAIQNITEDIVINMAKQVKKITNSKYLCLAGGVALNCVANGKLLKDKIFENIFIQPAAGDAGGAIGAALATYYIYYNKERKLNDDFDGMNGAYLGPEFSNFDIELCLKKCNAVYKKYDDFDELIDRAASLIAEANVIGWFQGRMEFGPRALGNRSIIADARNPEMQKKVNLNIKHRESFRPFAPSVLAEDVRDFFDLDVKSPYMLVVADVKKNRRKHLPDNYMQLSVYDKINYVKSDIPSITHTDFSARIQTVHRKTNEKYWKLISKFKEKTGCGMLLNTSFNVRGEPIVCTPEHAYKCFMKTEMDYLVMGNYLLYKN